MGKYLIAFSLLTPLIGLIFMELGAYSFAAHEFGFYNGSSFAYFVYLLLFYISFFFFTKRRFIVFGKYRQSKASYTLISYITVFISLLFLVLIIGPFGGYKVWLGLVDKGQFRSGLGFFGGFAYLMVKMFLPAILALNAFYYIKKEKRCRSDHFLLYFNFVLAFIFGASWGYKSTAIFILTPALLILYPKINFMKALRFFFVAIVLFVGFAAYFDKSKIELNEINILETQGSGNAIELVLYRLTVLQGDPCWKIWDLYINGKLESVEYHKTLYSLMGDKNLQLFFGISRDNFSDFIPYHFGLLLTYLCGNPTATIAEGYNVTGTVFSEAIIAGGIFGVVVFSTFAGIITAFVYQLISMSLKFNYPVLGAISSTYFCFNVFSWLNGGGVDTLFHISVIVGIFATIVFLISILEISRQIKI